jgi:TolA-binding protein/tRNA A-37 threonylcarbamoyl transferase component Bud32
MTGQTVSHYRVLEKLGEGGSAIVYRAEDLALGREVVLKFLPPEFSADYGRIARFQHEARTASSLNHPNICTIYEIAEHEGRHFLAMEFLDGEVLSRMVGRRPIETYRLVEIAIAIADALEAAHAEGVVHRDVKPANIFVTRREQVKLLDFGLAVFVPRGGVEGRGQVPLSATLTGGTVPYMSPEQVRGEELDHRSDLFSLGVVLYEMATGRRAFIGGTARDVTDAILNQSPIPVRDLNPSIPAELDRIIDKALEKNRKLRFQTAADVRADLQRLKRDLDSGSIVTATRPGPAGKWAGLLRPSSRRRIAATLGGAAMGCVVFFALTALKQHLSSAAPDGEFTARIGGADIALPPEVDVAASPPLARPSASPRIARRSKPPQQLVADAEASDVEERSRALGQEELRGARQKIDLKLYDQALETLRRVAGGTDGREALEAFFLIASVHETRGMTDDAIGAYLDIANRYADSTRAPEALFRMAEATIASKRVDRDAEARQTLTDLVRKYPGSSWAPRALMTRAELEERQARYRRDEVLGGSVASAIVTYREVVEQYDSTAFAPMAMWRLARAYLNAKRFDVAAATLEDLAARDHANYYDAWFAAGEVYDRRLRNPFRAHHAYAQVPRSSARYQEAQKRLRR